MELDELHVGDATTRPPGHGDAVAGGDVRIAGVQIDFAGAAAGEHRGAGAVCPHMSAFAVEHVGAQASVVVQTLLGAGDEIYGQMRFQHVDARMGPGPGDEHIADRLAGGVRHVHDTPLAMAAFLGQVVGRAVPIGGREAHAQRPQPVHAGRSPLGDEAHDARVTQAGARIDGIAHMGIQ